MCADNNNIRKLKDRNQNGMPEGAAAAAAGQDQTDSAKKNEQQALAERITELGAPQVSGCFSCFYPIQSSEKWWDLWNDNPGARYRV